MLKININIYLLIILCCSLCLGAEINLSNLIEIQNKTQQIPQTAEIVYVENKNDSSEPKLRPITSEMTPEQILWVENQNRIREINQKTMEEKTLLFDKMADMTMYKIKDLRDLKQIVEKYNISEDNFMNLNQDSTMLFDGEYSLIYSAEANNLHLDRITGGYSSFFKNSYLDPSRLFADYVKKRNLFEITEDGKKLVRLEVSGVHEGYEWQWLIDLDPEFGYRFRRFDIYINGKLRDTRILKYKLIKGYVIPISCERQWYSTDGQVIKEYGYNVKDVDVDIPLTEDDFVIDVPAGTSITDMIGQNLEDYISTRQNVSIKSLISMSAKRVSDEFLSSMIDQKATDVLAQDKQTIEIETIEEEKKLEPNSEISISNNNEQDNLGHEQEYLKSSFLMIGGVVAILFITTVAILRKR